MKRILPVSIKWGKRSSLAITVNPSNPHCPNREYWLLSYTIIVVGLRIGVQHMCPGVIMEVNGMYCLRWSAIWWSSQRVPVIMICSNIHCSLSNMGAWWCWRWHRLKVSEIWTWMSCARYRYSHVLRIEVWPHKIINCIINIQTLNNCDYINRTSVIVSTVNKNLQVAGAGGAFSNSLLEEETLIWGNRLKAKKSNSIIQIT